MKVLLDTHALIWALEASPNLSRTARDVIENGANEVLVSSVSAWEIAIKKALGRLEAPDDLAEAIDEAGFTRRLIGFEEMRQLARLPAHHGDPFDRMLVAQALTDGVPIVSKDSLIARYSVQTIW